MKIPEIKNPNQPPRECTTKEQRAERRKWCTKVGYNGVVSGLERSVIVEIIVSNFQLSERQADNYISRAFEILADDSMKDRKRIRQVALARYSRIFNQTIVKGDYRTAISAQEKIDKLNFLYDLTDDEKQIVRDKFEGFEFKLITSADTDSEPEPDGDQ